MAIRKRSEVQAGGTPPPAAGQTVGEFQWTESNGIAFVECKCGLKMSKASVLSGAASPSEGKCMSCGTAIPIPGALPVQQAFSAQPSTPAPPPQSFPLDAVLGAQADPYGLRPGGSPIENFSAILVKLAQRGFAVPLGDLAGFTPADREDAKKYAEGGDYFPPFLGKYAVRKPEPLAPSIPPPVEKSIAVPAAQGGAFEHTLLDAGAERVSYTWGMEKHTLVANSYSTVEVGPMTLSTALRPNETHGQALQRLIQEGDALMRQERERKIQSFVEAWRRGVQQANAR